MREFKKLENTFSEFKTDIFFYAGYHVGDKRLVELINNHDDKGGNLKLCTSNHNYTKEFTKSEMENPNNVRWYEFDTASEKYTWIAEELKKQGK